MQRKLAGIIHADVVGFSRLVGAQETFTLRRMKTLRKQLWDPIIGAHKGRVANTAGDSLLIEFGSVISAVRCAVELQKGMREHNADQGSDRKMLLRIGVNLGEVLYDEDDNDIHGDGVIMAARIQALTQPGGISVTGKVYEEVIGKVAVEFIDAGETMVKNVARPVRIFRIVLEGDTPDRTPLPSPPPKPEAQREPAAGAAGATVMAEPEANPVRPTVATMPARAGGWWLKGRDREGRDYEVFLDAGKMRAKDGIVLGRHPQQAQLVIGHPSLSRTHCRFKLDGDIVTVTDLNSLNGTVLEGRKLAAEETAMIKPGSRLSLGEVTLLLGEQTSGRTN